MTVKGRFSNEGFQLVRLTEEDLADDQVPEYLRIRGYRFENRAAAVHVFDQPGDYVVEA